MEEIIKKMKNHTDLWPWYWLSYGEKCYAFATVEAFPAREQDPFPEPGTELIPDNGSENSWVGENGVKMIINSWIANIEAQNGDTICSFIAAAHAKLIRSMPDKVNKLKIYYRIIDYGNAMWEHDEETAGNILAELERKLKYAPDTEEE